MKSSVFVVVLVLVVAVAAPTAHAQSTYCDTCIKLVGDLQADGTDKVCSMIGATQPPESTVCGWIVDHLADYILKQLDKGFNATNICRTIGMCSARGCPCGECQSAQFSARCLRFPNDCPSSDNNPLIAPATPTPSSSSPHAMSAATVDSLRAKLKGVKTQAAAALRGFLRHLKPSQDTNNHNLGFCLDGTCDSSHVGCCLACL